MRFIVRHNGASGIDICEAIPEAFWREVEVELRNKTSIEIPVACVRRIYVGVQWPNWQQLPWTLPMPAGIKRH